MTIKSLTHEKAELSNGNQTLVITRFTFWSWLFKNRYLPAGNIEVKEVISDLWNPSDILMIARRMQVHD